MQHAREIAVRILRGVSFQLAADRGIASWKLAPRIALLVRVAASAAAGASAAAEYFVARTGDDSDGLSAKTAFSSIGKPVALLKPGDTLTVLPGTYFESVSARISGTPAAPIVIRAARPGTVLLRGDVDAPRFRPAEGVDERITPSLTPSDSLPRTKTAREGILSE